MCRRRVAIDATLSEDEADAALDAMLAGDAGPDAESGAAMVLAAISFEARTGCNLGLVRSGSSLHALRVTDATDPSGSIWPDLLADFDALTDAPFGFHAVAGDYPAGCGSAYAVNGWYELTEATGGLYASICGDAGWAADLAPLLDYALPTGEYALTRTPVVETIAVTVDGAVVSAWRYEADVNTVFLDADAVPGRGARVEIAYDVAADCGG